MREQINARYPDGVFPHHGGHGLGVGVGEDPQIIPSEESVIEAGMVFAVEPGVYFGGRFGVRVEDTYVVTDQGGGESGKAPGPPPRPNLPPRRAPLLPFWGGGGGGAGRGGAPGAGVEERGGGGVKGGVARGRGRRARTGRRQARGRRPAAGRGGRTPPPVMAGCTTRAGSVCRDPVRRRSGPPRRQPARARAS